ncbi:MAG: hypothetical protein KKB59_14025, partial [Spirochaetes bacterium]|nr:hypothetical protein [Spirochaetota bacterium]
GAAAVEGAGAAGWEAAAWGSGVAGFAAAAPWEPAGEDPPHETDRAAAKTKAATAAGRDA